MGFLVPKAYLIEVINEILADAMTIRLYGNNKTPAPGDSASGYTEIAGGGYANKPIVFGGWIINTTSQDYPLAVYNAVQLWTFTGPINAPGTIYGWYLTRNSDGLLMAAERFGAGVVPFGPEAGSQARVLPKYSVRSQF